MKTFGLIGYPLTHSFSKKYFTNKFMDEGLTDCIYENFPIENIDEIKDVFQLHPTLAGLNVTIPYKEKVIPYLDEANEIVKETGACNCIKIHQGKKIGFNTDVIGFGKSLDVKLNASHQRALVLGTGGAAKAVYYALKQRNISFLKVSRSPSSPNIISYENIDKSLLDSHTLIINTTPLGMYPNTESAPSIPYQHLTPSHYLFDLVYNPDKTIFLQNGEAMGAIIENGKDMLRIQADASWEIWNS
jgi:shikimate dehydrogenase